MGTRGKPFQKGNPGKPKGAVSQTTTRVKEAFTTLLEANLEQLMEDVAGMKPKDRAYFLKDLAEYVIPKLSRTQAEVELGEETRQTLRSWTITPIPPKNAD